MRTSINRNGFSIFILSLFVILLFFAENCGGNNSDEGNNGNGSKIIDHSCTDITFIPESAINQAKANLHIAYGHTSHGSQLTDGMSALVDFANNGGRGLDLSDNIFQFQAGGNDGGNYLHLYEGDGYGDGDLEHDVGYYPEWVNETSDYLGTTDSNGRGSNHPEINVIIWSWCGQAGSKTEETMESEYLTPMSNFEAQYPGIVFIYMTGHLVGGSLTDSLHMRNEQIRNFCRINNKWLYDFADIESYDPDGNYYGDRLADDACNYDADNDGVLETDESNLPIDGDRNWASDWQAGHTEGVDWYSCSAAHTQALNGNRKAYAAWWLWARLSGWNGVSQ